MNILRRTIFSKLGIILLVIILIAGLTFWTRADRISNDFAEQLFNYPLPPHTKVIEKEVAHGKYFGRGGVAGYVEVIASVRFSTKLSKQEILEYYLNAGLFKHADSKERGAEPELYFQGGFQKVEEPEGFYYALNNEHKGYQPILSLMSEDCKECGIELTTEIPSEEMEYVVQLVSAFDDILDDSEDDYID
jgi:hypothetical protein